MPRAPAPAATPGFFRAVSLAILAALVASGLLNALRKDVREGFDEVAQISYVAEAQRDGGTWPALDGLRMLDPATFRFTDQPNYLNHPPLYYRALAALGPALEGRPDAILAYRALNLGLAVLAMAALLLLGRGVARTRFAFYAYCLPLATIPTGVALAGAVNNDNLAILGGALALLGLQRLLAGAGRSWLTAVVAGIVLAGWAKFTGLVLVGGCAALVFAYLAWRRRAGPAALAALALGLALGAAPYAAFCLRYGSPVPEVPGHLAMMLDGARELGWDAGRLSFPAYLLNFAALFTTQFLPTLAERTRLNDAALAFPIGLMALSLAGLACAAARLRRGAEQAVDVLALAGWAAIGLALAAHIRFGYRNHLATGWRLDGYPRYYLPLAGISVLGCFALLASLPEGRPRRAVIGFLVLGPLVSGLLGTVA